MNSVFLTFDIDWASDEVLADCIDVVERADVAATWFVTHETKLLGRLRENPNFELGIHPNFNFLMQGDPRNGANYQEVIERMMKLVPEATAVRSHSMTQSTPILQLFHDIGLKRDCNHFIPHHSGIMLRPWQLWTGMVKVPYFWEDDVECMYGMTHCEIEEVLKRPGLCVVDFHPIHVFLNTEELGRYERSRAYHQRHFELNAYVNRVAPGTRNHLTKLLGLKFPAQMEKAFE